MCEFGLLVIECYIGLECLVQLFNIDCFEDYVVILVEGCILVLLDYFDLVYCCVFGVGIMYLGSVIMCDKMYCCIEGDELDKIDM